MARLQLLALLGALVCSALADPGHGYVSSHANPGVLTCSCCKDDSCYPNGCSEPKIFTKGSPVALAGFAYTIPVAFDWTTLYDACASAYPASCPPVNDPETGKYLGWEDNDAGVTAFIFEVEGTVVYNGTRDSGPKGTKCDSGSAPCFSREAATACRVLESGTSAADALAQCFGQPGRGAERALMAELGAGDTVLSLDAATGEPRLDRVIVNQHKAAPALGSPLLTLAHSRGSIELTPDHVLHLDGDFRPAREAKAGSVLMANSERLTVSGVTQRYGGIINPLTASGTILAADAGSDTPVLATTYPEWIASWMLGSSLVPLPVSLSNLLAAAFPASVQRYYDSVLEPLFQAALPSLTALKAAAPSAAIAPTFVAADVLLGAGFVVFCADLKMVAVVAAAAAVAYARRRKL